jgi:SAM-dependent methyltransferase
MSDQTLDDWDEWFASQRTKLETAYLAGVYPWQQSGVGLHTPHTAHDWEVLRRPIADCVTTSGTFLDIGCANGYLLECLLCWTSERGLSLTPYGLDFSAQLLSLARRRLRQYAGHFFLGNAWDWSPPQQFDFVSASLDYVPYELRQAFARQLLERYVQDGGCLLLGEYLGRSTGMPELRIDEELEAWGFPLEMVKSSRLEHDPMRQTRVAVTRCFPHLVGIGHPSSAMS